MAATLADDISGLDIKHLVYMPIGHVVQKIYVPFKNFHVPSQYLYKSCKAYAYCWKNEYMPRLKIRLPCWARNHKSLCALGQDLHARARLNVEPCIFKCNFVNQNVLISIKISLNFVSKGPIDKKSLLVQIMAWRWPGDKPLPGPMMTHFNDAYMYVSTGLN